MHGLKNLFDRVARLGGDNVRETRPSPNDIVTDFLNTPERALAFDVARATASRPAPVLEQSKAHARAEDAAGKRLLVEGWRYLAHSYALVNQWQLLAFARRADVRVKVLDAPFFGRHWKTQAGLFDAADEAVLRSFEPVTLDDRADLTLRMTFPFDFSPSPRAPATVVFGTSESQILRKDQFPDLEAYERFHAAPPHPGVRVVTPSRWSAEGFYKSGFAPDRVLVVPHGADVQTFRPMPDLRAHIREQMGIFPGEFVFMSIGAMTGNKGLDVLLKAFAAVSRAYPHARLVLKGMDSLYRSRGFLSRSMHMLSAADLERVIERTVYFGRSFSHAKMAMFYQAADVYVSSYRAEGFNLPVLEAAACGVPVICTRGGATDDFVTEAFARRIDSRRLFSRHKDQELWRVEPDCEHLVFLMSRAIEDDAWLKQAAEAGPAHVRAHYTWDRVVDQLLRGVFA